VEWARRFTHIREKYNTVFCLETLKVEERLEDPNVDGRIVFKWILKNLDWGGG
jgi:hypothetical protein